eukprot:5827710-Ditylum_brightwellii.AAC.1
MMLLVRNVVLDTPPLLEEDEDKDNEDEVRDIEMMDKEDDDKDSKWDAEKVDEEEDDRDNKVNPLIIGQINGEFYNFI